MQTHKIIIKFLKDNGFEGNVDNITEMEKIDFIIKNNIERIDELIKCFYNIQELIYLMKNDINKIIRCGDFYYDYARKLAAFDYIEIILDDELYFVNKNFRTKKNNIEINNSSLEFYKSMNFIAKEDK